MLKRLTILALLCGSATYGQSTGLPNNPPQLPSNLYTVPASGSSSASSPVAWNKIGPVIQGGATDATVVQEPNVFITPTAQVVTNNATGAPVLGMFHTLGYSSCSLVYKESLDGINWFSSAISIASHAHSGISISGGTVYVTAATTCSGTNAIDIYSGADAGHLTLLKAAIVSSGGGPAWKATSLANSVIQQFNGTWYLFYDGLGGGKWSVGVATCTAPSSSMVCTDSGSNPIITNGSGTIGDMKSVRQISTNSYIAWAHATITGGTVLPTDEYFLTCQGGGCPVTGWTVSTNSVLYRTNPVEGVNTAVGQVADFSPITFNGSCYGYYGAFPSGNNGLNGGLVLVIANGITCEQFTSSTVQTIAQPPRNGSFGFPLHGTGSLALTSGVSQANPSGASVALTPGVWLLIGNGFFTPGASTTITYTNLQFSTSPSSGTFSASSFPSVASLCCPAAAGTSVASGANWSNNGLFYVAVVNANQTYYVNAAASFTGTVSVNADIWAVRIY